MTIDIRDKKFSLIELIMSVEDGSVLDAIEREINRINEKNLAQRSAFPDLAEAVRPIRSNVTLEDIDQEQDYTPFDYQEFRKLADEVGLEEPIEELLEVLGN